jgi:phytoene/squalene synthetase
VQDQTVHRYLDLATLREYARRSANPVGRIVLTMADCRSDEHFSLSDEICTALQFTNFWQDVARDYAIGRIYLPADAMQRHGFDETLIADTLSQAHSTPLCVREAIAQQCEQTRIGFQLGRPLVTMVPRWLAADIELFIEGGLATLNAIDRIDYNVLQQRPTVSKRQQAWLVMRTFFRRKILQRNVVAANARSENKLTREASVL